MKNKSSSNFKKEKEPEKDKHKQTSEELADFHLKTVARLIDKKREKATGIVPSNDSKQEKDFRAKYRENLKEKKRNNVVNKVDRNIVRQAVNFHPEVFALKDGRSWTQGSKTNQSNDDLEFQNKMKQLFEENYSQCGTTILPHNSDDSTSIATTDLHSKFHIGSLVDNYDRGNEIVVPQALAFLRHSLTFRMAVNKKIRNIRNIRTSLSSNVQLDREPINESNKLSDNNHFRLYHPYENEAQINALLNTLSEDNSSISPSYEGSSHKQIKTVGLMSKFIKDNSNLKLHPNKSSVHSSDIFRNRSNSAAGAIFNFQNPETNLHTDGNGEGRSKSFSHISNILIGSNKNLVMGTNPASDGDHANKNSTPLFSSLSECLFLIGPTEKDIYSIIPESSKWKPSRDESLDSLDNADYPLGLSRSETNEKIENKKPDSFPTPMIDASDIIEPSILFASNCNDPAVLSLLPLYCYPSGVDIQITSMSTSSIVNSNKAKNSLLRKNTGMFSLHSRQNAIASNSAYDIVGLNNSNTNSELERDPSQSGRSNSSNITSSSNSLQLPTSIKSNDMNDDTSNTKKPSMTSNTKNLQSSPPSTDIKTSFVLLFTVGNPPTLEYYLCIHVPMRFTDQKNRLYIQTSYVLCIQSKLPLFHFLFNVLEQFDSTLGGWRFTFPIPKQDPNFPILSELRQFNDLAIRLKRSMVPLYPFIGYDEEIDHDISILPNIEFHMNTFRGKRNASFSSNCYRSSYQKYYSQYMNGRSKTELESQFIVAKYLKLIENHPEDYPTMEQKMEREREETFLTLLWALPILLKNLPLDQIILALGCVLTEMKIIVKHKDFNVISSVIFSLLTLVKPLKWCPGNTVVVIVPDQLSDFTESPVPIIMGLPKLPEGFFLNEGYVVIDLHEKIVHLNPSDVVVSHTILLPHAAKLINALKTHAEVILRLTRKKKTNRLRQKLSMMSMLKDTFKTDDPVNNVSPFSNSVESKEGDAVQTSPLSDNSKAVSSTTNANKAGDSAVYRVISNQVDYLTQMTIPLEMNVTSTDHAILLSAVRSFASLVYSHIEAIVNTTVKIRIDIKAELKKKYRLLTILGNGNKENVPSNTPKIKTTPSQSKNISANESIIDNSQSASIFEMNEICVTPDIAVSELDPQEQLNLSSSNQNNTVIPTDIDGNVVTENLESTVRSSEGGHDGEKGTNPESVAVSSTTSNNNTKARKSLDKVNRTSLDSSRSSLNKTLPPDRTSKSLQNSKMLVAKGSTDKKIKSSEIKSSAVVQSSVDRNSRKSVNISVPNKSKLTVALPRNSLKDKVKVTGAPQSKSGVAKDLTASNPTELNNAANPIIKQVGTPVSESRLPETTSHGKSLEELILPLLNDNEGSGKLSETIIFPSQVVPSPTSPPLSTSPQVFGKVIKISPPPENPLQQRRKFPLTPTSTTAAMKSTDVNGATVESNRNGLQSDSSPSFENKKELYVDSKTLMDREYSIEKSNSMYSSFTEHSFVASSVLNDSMEKETVSSSSSSLPSVKTNAPMLLKKEIGENGMKFIERFLETQLFSNYCQFQKAMQVSERHGNVSVSESGSGSSVRSSVRMPNLSKASTGLSLERDLLIPDQHELNSIDEDNTSYNINRHSKSFDRTNLTGDSPLRVGKSVIKIRRSIRIKDKRKSKNLKAKIPMTEIEKEELDSLIEVFVTILSGTVPMKSDKLKDLLEVYRNLYPNDINYEYKDSLRVKYKDIFAKCESINLQELPLQSIFTMFNHKSSSPRMHHEGYSNQKQDDASSAQNTKLLSALKSRLIWCNGLICNGLCNTPTCTSICMKLWEEKLQKLRREAVIKDIIQKNRNSNLLPKTMTVNVVKFGGKPEDMKKSLKIALVAPIETSKHHKETQSQYQQREELIRSSTAVAEVAKMKKQSRKSLSHKQPEIVTGPFIPSKSSSSSSTKSSKSSIRANQEIVYARATSSPYTIALAKYFSTKQTKILRWQKSNAMKILHRFLYRFIYFVRKVKFIDKVITIQSITRGFFVRNHVAEIFETLINRKITRLLACIRIRNYLRYHINGIVLRFNRRKLIEAEKRRRNISIPVISSNKQILSSPSKLHRNIIHQSNSGSVEVNSDFLIANLKKAYFDSKANNYTKKQQYYSPTNEMIHPLANYRRKSSGSVPGPSPRDSFEKSDQSSSSSSVSHSDKPSPIEVSDVTNGNDMRLSFPSSSISHLNGNDQYISNSKSSESRTDSLTLHSFTQSAKEPGNDSFLFASKDSFSFDLSSSYPIEKLVFTHENRMASPMRQSSGSEPSSTPSSTYELSMDKSMSHRALAAMGMRLESAQRSQDENSQFGSEIPTPFPTDTSKTNPNKPHSFHLNILNKNLLPKFLSRASLPSFHIRSKSDDDPFRNHTPNSMGSPRGEDSEFNEALKARSKSDELQSEPHTVRSMWSRNSSNASTTLFSIRNRLLNGKSSSYNKGRSSTSDIHADNQSSNNDYMPSIQLQLPDTVRAKQDKYYNKTDESPLLDGALDDKSDTSSQISAVETILDAETSALMNKNLYYKNSMSPPSGNNSTKHNFHETKRNAKKIVVSSTPSVPFIASPSSNIPTLNIDYHSSEGSDDEGLDDDNSQSPLSGSRKPLGTSSYSKNKDVNMLDVKVKSSSSGSGSKKSPTSIKARHRLELRRVVKTVRKKNETRKLSRLFSLHQRDRGIKLNHDNEADPLLSSTTGEDITPSQHIAPATSSESIQLGDNKKEISPMTTARSESSDKRLCSDDFPSFDIELPEDQSHAPSDVWDHFALGSTEYPDASMFDILKDVKKPTTNENSLPPLSIALDDLSVGQSVPNIEGSSERSNDSQGNPASLLPISSSIKLSKTLRKSKSAIRQYAEERNYDLLHIVTNPRSNSSSAMIPFNGSSPIKVSRPHEELLPKAQTSEELKNGLQNVSTRKGSAGGKASVLTRMATPKIHSPINSIPTDLKQSTEQSKTTKEEVTPRLSLDTPKILSNTQLSTMAASPSLSLDTNIKIDPSINPLTFPSPSNPKIPSFRRLLSGKKLSVSRMMMASTSSNALSGSEKLEYEFDLENLNESDEDDDSDEEDELNGVKGSQVRDIITDELNKLPLKLFNTGHLLHQQLQTLLDLYRLLRTGIQVLKHGRSGKPKDKLLFCDNIMQRMYWRTLGSKIDPDFEQVEQPPSSNGHDGEVHQSNHVVPFSIKNIIRNDRSSANHQRLSSITKSNSERVLYLRDIIEIRYDYSTEVMKRSLEKGYVDIHRPLCVISLIYADHKSLDFEVEEKYWGPIYHAVLILIHYYQELDKDSQLIPLASQPNQENQDDESYLLSSSTNMLQHEGESEKNDPNSMELKGYLSYQALNRGDKNHRK